MTQLLRLAITADLHWGHHVRGVAASRLLFDFLARQPLDVLILAGDTGTGSLHGDCLAQLADLPCRKAAVPGNHDVWVKFDADFNSLDLYETHLPKISAAHGFHYLDQGPLLLPEADLAIVGSMNWYDYSWALSQLRELFPDELGRLETKRFSRGRHNDANFVRWALNDVSFTEHIVRTFERHLLLALESVGRVIVVTHHPPIYDLGFPRPAPPTNLDGLLWDAFSGNTLIEGVLERHASRIAFLFCGHTHRARQTTWKGIPAYNIGGDYHFKRLLLLDWPTGSLEAHQFGDPS